MAAVQANAELIARLGIELTAFGPDTIAVQAFPGLLANLDVAEFARDLLDTLVQTQAPTNSEILLAEVLELMACKAAIKAGQRLQPDEIDALLAQRDQVERGSNCPHGRPTSLSLSMRDLQRQFKRT
jgi:DNA mismatch repair protein MutL